MSMSISPLQAKNFRLMAAHTITAAGDYHPTAPSVGHVPSGLGGGKGYNISVTIGDNVFASGKAAIIHEAHLSPQGTAVILIHDESDGLMQDDAFRLASTQAIHGDTLTGPLYLPNGFHVELVSGNATFHVVYEEIIAAP